MNTTGQLAPWCDVIYACDARWWSEYADTLPAGPERWTADESAANKHSLRHIHTRDEPGLSAVPTVIHQGGNSGYQALGLAHAWGASRVVLLGYDMQRTGGASHWHGDHKGGLPNLGPALETWPARFEAVQRQWPYVINATRETALTCFSRRPLADALREEPERAMPLILAGMHGMGDNLHQRAIVRHFMQTREVWLETPWPSIYHDLVGPRLRLMTRGSTLRTQAVNAAREAHLYAAGRPPQGCEVIRVSTPPALIRSERGVLAAMCKLVGAPVGDFRMPIPDEWSVVGMPHADGRPLVVVRPLVERTEWTGCKTRNPPVEQYNALIEQVRRESGAYVVSVADLVDGKEWLAGPAPAADLALHGGELDFQRLAVLWRAADLVITSPGFGAVLAQAVETPAIIAFGGYEGNYSFDAGARYSPTLALGSGCDCFTHTHQCIKAWPDGWSAQVTQWLIDAIVNKDKIGTP